MKKFALLFCLMVMSPFTLAEEMVGGLIVKMQPAQPGARVTISRARLDTLSRAAGVALRHSRSLASRAELFHLPTAVPLQEAQRISERIATQPGVLYAEPDRRYRPLQVPNDPLYVLYQWNLQTQTANEGGTNLELAWVTTTGDPGVVVAVVDTGILSHVDLDPARILGGYDFISEDPIYSDLFDMDGTVGRDADPSDPGDWVAADTDPVLVALGCPELDSSWHGSHVAGTIGANSNNALGVAGVTWAGKILPLRAIGKCGGLLSDISDAMLWAGGVSVAGVPDNTSPAQVVNLSLGGSGACSNTEQLTIDTLHSLGVLVVVAAGNENVDISNSAPANCDGVVAVAAHRRDGLRASYSNYGVGVDISAPGGDNVFIDPARGIVAPINDSKTIPTGNDAYGSYAGTSMAAPHIAGIAALMHAAHGAAKPLSPDQIKREIQLSAAPFPAASDCAQKLCGTGLVDAAAAVAAVNGPVSPVAVVESDVISVVGGSTVNLIGSGSSDDGAITNYSWQQDIGDSTQVTLTGATSANASFVAPNLFTLLNFTLTVTDDEVSPLSDSAQMLVVVNNSTPVLNPIGSKSGFAGKAISFTVSASDADGGLPSLSASGLPAGASFSDNGDGSGTFSWSSPVKGYYAMSFRATDELDPTLVDSEAVALTITSVPVTTTSSGGGGTFGPLWLLPLFALLRRRRRDR